MIISIILNKNLTTMLIHQLIGTINILIYVSDPSKVVAICISFLPHYRKNFIHIYIFVYKSVAHKGTKRAKHVLSKRALSSRMAWAGRKKTIHAAPLPTSSRLM